MKSDKLLQGVSALRIIGKTINESDIGDKDKARIKGCLNTLADILEEMFFEMVKSDELLAKGMSAD